MKTHKVDVEEGICRAARRLLESGDAHETDRIEAYRGETLCLSAGIKWAADHTVDQNRLRFRKWKPFPEKNDDNSDLWD